MIALENIQNMILDMYAHVTLTTSSLPTVSIGDFKGSCLKSGEKLYVGQYLASNAKTTTMQLQSTGDLCLFTVASTPYVYGFQNTQYWTQRWCLGMTNSNPSYVEVSATSGCLQLVDTSGHAYWKSGQCYVDGAFLDMQDDFNLVLYSNRNYNTYSPEWACGGGGPFTYYDSSGAYHYSGETGKCYLNGVNPDRTCNAAAPKTPVSQWHGNCLQNPTYLYVGDYLVSQNNNYIMQYMINGDVCVYALPTTSTSIITYDNYIQTTSDDWTIHWCYGVTDSHPSHMNINLALGRLELVDTSGTAYYNSQFSNSFHIILADDGGVSLVDGTGADTCLSNIPTYQPTEEPSFKPSYSFAPSPNPTQIPTFSPTVFCPAGFMSLPTTSQCYQLNWNSLNWFDAERYCNLLEGHLVSISSYGEYSDIYQYIMNPNGLQYTDFWIGANDISSEGTFTWTDSNPLSYTIWRYGEPNNDLGLEHCASSRHSYYDSPGWNDMPCSSAMVSICKYADGESVSSSVYLPANTYCPPDYKYFHGNCLAMSPLGYTLESTIPYCASTNGQLAMPTTAAANRWYYEFIRYSQVYNYPVYIDGIKRSDGQWIWSSTQQLVSYTNWASGQPSNYYGSDSNYILFRASGNGDWTNTIYYGSSRYALCQVTPSSTLFPSTSRPSIYPTLKPTLKSEFWTGKPVSYTDDFPTDDYRNVDDDSVTMIIIGPVLAGVIPLLLVGLYYLRQYFVYRQSQIAPMVSNNEYAPTGGGGMYIAQSAQYQPAPTSYSMEPSAPPLTLSYTQPQGNYFQPVNVYNNQSSTGINYNQPNVVMPMSTTAAYPTGYTPAYNNYTTVPYSSNGPVRGEFQMVPTTYATSAYVIPSSYEPIQTGVILDDHGEYSYQNSHNEKSIAIVQDYDVL